MNADEEFAQLTDKYLSRMASVQCPEEEYIDALRDAITQIRDVIQAAEEMRRK